MAISQGNEQNIHGPHQKAACTACTYIHGHCVDVVNLVNAPLDSQRLAEEIALSARTPTIYYLPYPCLYVREDHWKPT